MTRSRFALTLLCVLVALVVNSCKRRPHEVQIGSILGLTGDNAAYGVKMQRGLQMAVDDLRLTPGGNVQPLKLLVEDSQFNPQKAVVAYRKLTSIDGVRIIVGITGSKNAMAICEAAREDPVVIVDALSSAPKISTVCGHNYFRVMASDALAGSYNATWAIESGAKKFAVVFMEDDWGTSYRDAVLRSLGKRGMTGTVAYGVTEKTRNFREMIDRLRTDQPDTVFLLTYAAAGSAFMQQLRQAGLWPAVYGSDNISSAEFTTAGPETVEGVRVAIPASTHGSAYNDFANRYRARFNEDPDVNAIKSYDAMRLSVSVIREVGPEPAKIADRLLAPGFGYEGVSGTIRFDETGDLVGQEYTRMVYKAGKLVELR